jgi:translation elongation factor EF-Tu-like GTPase
MEPTYDIEAIVTFLPTEHGGRKGYAGRGYRPQFYYDGHDWDTAHHYPDVERVEPGQTARVLVQFISPQAHVGKLRPGSAFLVREGQRIVGYGAVTRILSLEERARHVLAQSHAGAG